MSMATASYFFPTPSAAMIRTGDFPSSSSICSAPMATAPFPSPFFSPTTTPMHAPTSAFPPPPFFFGASPHSPYPAYTPPPAPAYAPLPLFPYPPPAQAPPPESTAPPSPTPASVFHPAPVSGFSPTPPILYPAPAPVSPYPTPTQIDHQFPSVSVHHPVHAAPQTNADPTLSSSVELPAVPKPWVDSAPNAAVPAVADERVTATDVFLHQLQRELLDMQVRLCQQQARQQTSFNTLQGELAKLKPRVSQCTAPMGKQSSAAASSSPSSDRSQFGTSSTANVAPMVFGEMPTPISGHGTQSPPKQTSAAENLRVTAQWSVGAQAEGLATVNCSKTNNSDDYEPRLGHLVKLPIIVQDVPDVKKEMPVQDVPECQALMDLDMAQSKEEEEEQKDSEQPPKCSSESTKDSLLQVVTGLAFPEEGEPHATRYIKFTHGQDTQEIVVSDLAPGYAKDSACLKITSDVQDFSFGLQQQDDVRACSCPDLEASVSVVTNSSQLSSEHSMRELRLLWDPGASAVIVIPLKNGSGNYFFSHDKADLWSQSEHQCIVLRVVFEEVMLDKPPAKPPDRFRIADSSLQDICVLLEAIPSCKRSVFSLGNFSVSDLIKTGNWK